MTFWQENYPFVKEIYTDRHTKMADWMENVEKAISRILADKVYTSAEFKRERDIFYVSAKSFIKNINPLFQSIFFQIFMTEFLHLFLFVILQSCKTRHL